MNRDPSALRRAAPALGAAMLFGASTPLAKWLGADIAPLLLAGLLYLGSGIGLGAWLAVRGLRARRGAAAPLAWRMPRRDWPWLAAAIGFGGIAGPALLMTGLARTDAAPAALLLNLETVLTALIAWWVFDENADRRIVLGMAAIVAGGALLAWQPGAARLSGGALLIVAACTCWAIDNNLTLKVAAHDATLVAVLKGGVAGAFNTALALATGAALPGPVALGATLAVGFAGYGVSLALFVVALRTLGSARAGAYFAVAPLVGVALSFVLWPALPGAPFWLAAALMATGVWLHLSERHVHEHAHAPLAHTHPHTHDEHHRHAHAGGGDGREPHSHPHVHTALVHTHPHVPDLHHRHRHAGSGDAAPPDAAAHDARGRDGAAHVAAPGGATAAAEAGGDASFRNATAPDAAAAPRARRPGDRS